jgi:hypothetical protein
MRRFIARFGYYILAAIGLIVLLVVSLFWFQENPHIQPNAFYVDEETSEELVRPVTEIPPLIGKSGKPTLVRATKISCDGGKTSRIAFLESFTPEAQAQLKTLPPESTQRIDVIRRGAIIRLPEPGSPWVLDSSSEGQRIRENVSCPSGATPTLVLPE